VSYRGRSANLAHNSVQERCGRPSRLGAPWLRQKGGGKRGASMVRVHGYGVITGTNRGTQFVMDGIQNRRFVPCVTPLHGFLIAATGVCSQLHNCSATHSRVTIG
jgi:hypothetical protein